MLDFQKEMVDAKVQVIAANKPAEAATTAAAPPKRKRKMWLVNFVINNCPFLYFVRYFTPYELFI